MVLALGRNNPVISPPPPPILFYLAQLIFREEIRVLEKSTFLRSFPRLTPPKSLSFSPVYPVNGFTAKNLQATPLL